MFLRIANVYLIFRHSQKKTKPFGIKINIDLEATSVEKKIYICMGHSYPLWIEYSGLTHDLILLLSQREAKLVG